MALGYPTLLCVVPESLTAGERLGASLRILGDELGLFLSHPCQTVRRVCSRVFGDAIAL